MFRKFLFKHVAGPLLGTIAAKVGEAVGDVIAYHINPPAPPECSHETIVEGCPGCEPKEG